MAAVFPCLPAELVGIWAGLRRSGSQPGNSSQRVQNKRMLMFITCGLLLYQLPVHHSGAVGGL